MPFNRRLEKFLNRQLNGQPIVNYFNLEKKNADFKITVQPCDRYCIINIYYYNFGTYFEFPNLPPEINNYIYNFTQTLVNLNIKVDPPLNYPFEPVIWSLLNIKSKSSSHIDITEYFKYIISLHNERYINDWSAVIYFEKDLLLFLELIKGLEYL